MRKKLKETSGATKLSRKQRIADVCQKESTEFNFHHRDTSLNEMDLKTF